MNTKMALTLILSFMNIMASDCKKLIPLIVNKCPYGTIGKTVGLVKAVAYKKDDIIIVLYSFKNDRKAILISGGDAVEVEGVVKGKSFYYKNNEYKFICSKKINIYD